MASEFRVDAVSWICGQSTVALTLEEEGIYVRLLCWCWHEGSIPADVMLAAKLAKSGPIAAVRNVLALFTPRGDGTRLGHDLLDEQRRGAV